MTIVDKHHRPLREGQLVRICYYEEGLQRLLTVEGTIVKINHHYRLATLVLTIKALQPQRSWVEYRRPGDYFDVCLPGERQGDTYVCDLKDNGAEEQHPHVEILQPESA